MLFLLTCTPLGQSGLLADWMKSHVNVFYNVYDAPKTWHGYMRTFLTESFIFTIPVQDTPQTRFLSKQLADLKKLQKSLLLFTRLVSLLKTKLN